MTKRVEKAVELFNAGYNCAQATAAAFASDFEVDVVLAERVMAGFGAGTGGLRETCGAVSAMVFVAGLHAGDGLERDVARKRAVYRLVRSMREDFVKVHGSSCCRELLRRASVDPVQDPRVRSPEYYATRPCARFVATAAEIIERELLSSPR